MKNQFRTILLIMSIILILTGCNSNVENEDVNEKGIYKGFYFGMSSDEIRTMQKSDEVRIHDGNLIYLTKIKDITFEVVFGINSKDELFTILLLPTDELHKGDGVYEMLDSAHEVYQDIHYDLETKFGQPTETENFDSDLLGGLNFSNQSKWDTDSANISINHMLLTDKYFFVVQYESKEFYEDDFDL